MASDYEQLEVDLEGALWFTAIPEYPFSDPNPPPFSTRIIKRQEIPPNIDIPILAPELIDTVLDFLHQDYIALEACSLVCKAWLPASRLHLFHTMKFTASDVAMFAQYCNARTPGFPSPASYTIDLEICGPNDSWQPLESLVGNLFQKVQSLRLHDLYFSRCLSAFDALTVFPSLTSVHFSDVYWYPEQDIGEMDPDAPLPQLSTLKLRMREEFNMDPFLNFLGLFKSINTLQLPIDESTRLPSVTSYFASAGQSIHHLTLDFFHNHGTMGGLGPLSSIDTLELRFFSHFTWRQQAYAVLSDLASTSLKELRVILIGSYCDHTDRVGWDPLVAVFDRPELKQLKVLAWEFPGSLCNVHGDRLESAILAERFRARFQSVEARGIMSIWTNE